MSQTTISLSEVRKEYLIKFVAARKSWETSLKSKVETDVEYWWGQLTKWGALMDLMTRLQNELKGRTKHGS